MKREIVLYSILIALVSFSISTAIINNFTESIVLSKKEETKFLLENQATSLSNKFVIIEERLNAVKTYLVATGGSFDDFGKVKDNIIKKKNVRNILFAPGGIVQKVFPIEGNEQVLGMDLLSEKNKSVDEARQALESDEIVFSGPYDLIQGGCALSERVAVDFGATRGLISLTVDFPAFINEEASNYLENAGYDYVLQYKNEEGNFITILKNNDLSVKDFVQYEFLVKNLDFKFYAMPSKGWIDSRTSFGYKINSVLISILLGTLGGILLFKRKQLENSAKRDKLTKLYNREGALEAVELKMRSEKFNSCAFILMDLDHFKSVNDIMGHPKGDEVLQETANIISALLRDTDIIARLGGDEFVIFLTFNGQRDFVFKKANEIRSALERTIIDEKNHSVDVSVSIGISFAKDLKKKKKKLYNDADAALYHTKEKGRNGVSFYNEENAVCETVNVI